MRTVTTHQPCPSWCTLPADHGYLDPGDETITHVGHEMKVRHVDVSADGRSAHVGVAIYQHEEVTAAGSRWHAATVDVDVSAPGEGLTAAQARQVAAALLDAADQLDAISRA